MTTRTAVILVAGLGSRLAPLTNDRPKALVDLGGETILHRAVRLLGAHGVRRIVLATGYRHDAILRVVPELDVKVELVENPRYASTQNSVSLALCAQAIQGESFFKLDGDLVFDPQVLGRLEALDEPVAVGVDGSRQADEEAMKVRLEGTRIVAFGKQIPLVASGGESIGVERLSSDAGVVVMDRLREAMARGDDQRYYEDHYGDLIAEGKLVAHAVEVGDLPWTEVDDHRDLAHARALAAAR